MVRHVGVEAEPAEPAIGQVEVNLLAQPPLEADAVAVADNQHPDHKLGINRRPANVAIERREPIAKLNQDPCHDRIDPAQEMVRWNAPFEVEQVKQLDLIGPLPTHHGKPPPLKASSKRNYCSAKITSSFNGIGQERTCRRH